MKTETNILERIKKIMKFYNLTERQFCIKSNIKQSTLNSAFSRNQCDLKMSTITSILNAFADIRFEWLVMGEGDMMNGKTYHQEFMSHSVSEDGNYFNINDRVKLLESQIEIMQYTIELQKQRIADLEGKKGKRAV